eukprot:TRINITY_DN8698_c0_g1_i2.p1 TRINITY_DN8698_c0_g1~~TRINITY_DN8698_c0_g1_i2.p1  ORF type:complete len:313 (+),score=43.36 TRINITY_DN8698_c0_g1_i2:96-1034(+)
MTQSEEAIKNCLLATGGYDHQIKFWRVDNGSCHRSIPHPDSQINVLAITADRLNIASGGHSKIRMYDTQQEGNNTPTEYAGHTNNVTDICFSLDATCMASSSEDGSVKIWDFRASQEHQRNFNHQASVSSVVLHPDMPHVFSADEQGRVVRWDLRANRCEEHLIPEPDVGIRNISISPDGNHLAAVNNEGNCYIWDLTPQECQAKLKLEVHPNAYVLSCGFSPDSSRFFTTGSDHLVKLYDSEQFDCFATLEGHTKWVWGAEFSSDSAFLATVSSDRTARLWGLGGPTIECELVCKGHQRAVTAVALNDGPT